MKGDPAVTECCRRVVAAYSYLCNQGQEVDVFVLCEELVKNV